MRKAKRSNSKLLKVVDNTSVSVETKKQQDEDKAYQDFNEKCKELIRGEIRILFENSKADLSKFLLFLFKIFIKLYISKTFLLSKLAMSTKSFFPSQ